MKLKELKELIEGCHPEDLNNDIEAVVSLQIMRYSPPKV